MAYPFLLSHENTPRAAAARVRATKNPARSPARAADVLSVNTLFWKILVTRVKRKVGEFNCGGFQGWQGLVRGSLRYPQDARRSGLATAIQAEMCSQRCSAKPRLPRR